MERPRTEAMNELIYSFIGSLRAWLRENENVLHTNKIAVDIFPYTLHYGICAQFTHEHFEAGFYVWEKLHWHVAMSDIEFVDWRISDWDPEYQVEFVHYEYATILEMLDTLDMLKNRLLLAQQENP